MYTLEEWLAPKEEKVITRNPDLQRRLLREGEENIKLANSINIMIKYKMTYLPEEEYLKYNYEKKKPIFLPHIQRHHLIRPSWDDLG